MLAGERAPERAPTRRLREEGDSPVAWFAGVDLAWIPGGQSGYCLLEGDSGGADVVADAVLRHRPDGIASALAQLPGPIVVAVDGPLLCGDARDAEREVGRAFGRYKAAAHSASYALLERTGRNAGPELAAALADRGFTLDPRAPGAPRLAIEVYPHACHVTWFGLPERLRYKPRFRVAIRRRGLAELQARLRAFAPGVSLRTAGAACLDADPYALRGRDLKELEDRLDALTCAIAAFLARRDGLEAGELLGGYPAGFVAVPGLRRDPRFASRFTSVPAPTLP